MRGRPHSAILIAIPVAVLMVAGLEMTRLPVEFYFQSFGNGFKAFMLSLRGVFDFLWAPILYQLNLAGLAALGRGRARTIPYIVPGALLSLGICIHCYLVLSGYGPFLGYRPFIILYSLLALFLAWCALVLLNPAMISGAGRLKGVFRWGTPALALSAFLLTHILNRRLYPGQYATMHLSLMQINYLLLHLGLSTLFIFLKKLPAGPRSLRWLAGAILLNLAILAFPLADGAFSDSARGSFLRFTDLGRSYSLRERRPVPSRHNRCKAPSKPMDRNLALSLFETHNHLPRLPQGFELSRYNILLISVEAMRYKDTHLHDPQRGVTPALHAFVRNGALWFERAYANAPGTLQSFSSLFTMKYPSHTRLKLISRWHGRLSEMEKTAAEVLRQNGYHTFYVGHNFKSHFSKGGKIQGLHQGFGEIHFAPGTVRARRDPTIDEQIRSKAEKVLERLKQEGKRFFGWLFLESPHYPYLRRYEDLPGTTEHQRYRQEIRYADHQLGKLFAYLKRSGLLKKTIIIVHGDHGEGFGEHARTRHADLYSEMTRIPLVLSIPGHHGGKLEGPTALINLFPWLFLKGPAPLYHFAALRLQAHIAPMMKQTGGAVVIEMLCPGCGRASLVYREHRLVYDFPSGYVELYDLREDPDEQRNIFNRDNKRRRLFQQRLNRYLDLRAAWRGGQGKPAASTYPRKTLALGSKVKGKRWRLYAVEYARSRGVPLRWLSPRAPLTSTVDMSWYFFVALGHGRAVLIDTGTDIFARAPAGRRARRWLINRARPVTAALAALGLKPGQVTDVLLTHRHWDHIGGLASFSGARVHMHRDAWGKLKGASRGRFSRLLKRLEDNGAYRGFQRTPHEPLKGLALLETGGHTRHHCAAVIRCAGKRAVIAGDIAYLFSQLASPAAALLRKEAGTGALLLPGHDPKLFESHPSGIDGVAVICE